MARPHPFRRHDLGRVHHRLAFWIAFALFLAAAAIYVASDDLAWRPAPPQTESP
ncbi:hypothetical protein [Methylocella sp.]|uniref:hypothetical protein n=1 Tax=Methylocella sp. TaxID=1978226 RepID=UPI0035B3DA18